MGTAIGAALGILVYALGPLGFPLRFAGWWPARLYDAALVLGALLALCAPVAAGRGGDPAGRRLAARSSRVRHGAMAGLCTGAAAALVISVLSTATIALLPHDAGLRDWAAGHIGQWTPVVGQVTPVVGPRLGYVAGNSAFAAGYLIVLLLSPLFGCGLGAWAGRAGGWPPWRPARSVHRSERHGRSAHPQRTAPAGRLGPSAGRGAAGLLRDPRRGARRAVRPPDQAGPP